MNHKVGTREEHLAPLGRNEGPNGNMGKWMRRHDEYGA